jgi:phosphonate transport system substrate-binding protein
MEEIAALEVEFFPVGNRTAAATALEFEQVDVVMTGPSEYVAIQSRIEAVKPIVSFARPAYASIFIVPEEAGIETLVDLEGKRISMKGVGSTTGHIIPPTCCTRPGSTSTAT